MYISIQFLESTCKKRFISVYLNNSDSSMFLCLTSSDIFGTLTTLSSSVMCFFYRSLLFLLSFAFLQYFYGPAMK